MANGPLVEPVPVWEREFPGRYAAEINALDQAKINYTIDKPALEMGRLRIALEWPVKGNVVALEVLFPEAYPYFRPTVLLKGDPQQWPRRHCSPFDGTLCLLGRDTTQWPTGWTLADLLEEQLENALTGDGEEDPQGEPTEYWWNTGSSPDSFVLVDSEWDLGSRDWGYLKIMCAGSGGNPPRLRGVVLEVLDNEKNALFNWDGQPPAIFSDLDSQVVTVPWIRLDHTIWPDGRATELFKLINETPVLKQQFARQLGQNLFGFPFATIYPSELALQTSGPAWLFTLLHGPPYVFGKKPSRPPNVAVVATYRAGPCDIGSRVPDVNSLRSASIGIAGVGAIGGPLAAELARSGVSELRLLDGDRVEPGNSIRWPLGSSAWGRFKVEALCEHVAAEYNRTRVIALPHQLGGAADSPEEEDGALLSRLLVGTQLTIDATASFGVTSLVHARCRAEQIPLIQAYATPSVHGGCVVKYDPKGACPICIEHHRFRGTAPKPSGYGAMSDQ
jgi:hypothetical protein